MIGFVLFGLFWIGLGSILIGHVLLALLRTVAARDWPTAPGNVTLAQPVMSQPGYKNRRRHGASVRYRYQVGRKFYESNQLSFWFHSFNGPTERVLSRYAAGDKLSVAYNPNDPAMAVIERTVPMDYLLLRLCIGGGFAAVGVLMINTAT
ncbi:MAG TPA: DUF3592 domain-containing protein [Herpetosiphonaceae bacterium]